MGHEPYLNIKNIDSWKHITQFRISAHKLKIKTGRYNSNNGYVDPDCRLCMQCNKNEKH